MDNVATTGHVELNIDKRGRLGSRPVNTGSGCTGRNSSCIDDKVPHLAIENIGRNPVQVGREVRVAVDQAKAREVGGGLDDRAVGRVTN